MAEGIVYHSLDSPSASLYGAHELAPNDNINKEFFAHWLDTLGRENPLFNLAPDLSNIDEVVEQIKNIEGL